LTFAEFFFGIAPSTESRIQAVTLPELSGPYSVGRRYFDWVDESRPDPFHKSSKRELVVAVWYPAQTIGPVQAGPYLPGNSDLLARVHSMMMRVRVQSFWAALLHNPLPKEFFAEINTHAVDNAASSSQSPRFPVLLFSPGFSATPTEYTAVLEDITSHGYIVVAITPTDFVPVTIFENGRRAYLPAWDPSLYDLESDYPVWVRDMTFVLNKVSEQNEDPHSPFFGHLDMARVGAFGHSFGGAASAGACHSDARIKAGMNLDGTPFGDRSTWKFPQPFMLVESDRPYRNRAAEEFYQGLMNGYRVVIKGSTHHGFMDEAILPLPDDRREILVGSIAGPRMVQITSFLVRAFFDTYLQSKPSTSLNGISTEFPEITMSMHTATTAKVAP
jgi:predicted dienelactone hydrolase